MEIWKSEEKFGEDTILLISISLIQLKLLRKKMNRNLPSLHYFFAEN